MAAIDFPASPATNQIFSAANGVVYQYNGTLWLTLAALGGTTLQTVTFETGAVATGTTQIPLDDTIPQISEGDQYMTLAITPRSATSTLIIDVTWIGAASISAHMTSALFQDATANALAAAALSTNAADAMMTISYRHKMTSGTTSATTFRVRNGLNGVGTTTFNGRTAARLLGGTMASSIVIREVA